MSDKDEDKVNDPFTHRVKIEMTGPARGKVWLDDFEVKGCFKIDLDVEVKKENRMMLWINCHHLEVIASDVQVGVQIDALLPATQHALEAAESLIKINYEGTSEYGEMMKTLEPIRKTIARVNADKEFAQPHHGHNEETQP